MQPTHVDVLIIGAGLAGTSAAIALARAGYSVALIDMRAVYPPEFKAEKFGSGHMALFKKLDLEPIIRPCLTEFNDLMIYHHGQPFLRKKNTEYGFTYGGLVNSLRAALPNQVKLMIGKVQDIKTSADKQQVTLEDGSKIEARLLVVATGQIDTIRRSLGIEQNIISKQHSMSIGFNLAKSAKDCPFETLTYHGDDPALQMAYLTLFPIGETMRGNLFVYRQIGEEWVKKFQQNPSETMAEMMPEIREMCSDFVLDGQAEIRTIDLKNSQNHKQHGVVLVGDACLTTCPVTGDGIRRAMNDVAQLCLIHVPRWLATPGMDAAKISEFYDDPVKVKVDGDAMAISQHSRAMVTKTGVPWTLRRTGKKLARQGFMIANTLLQGKLGPNLNMKA